MRRPGLVVRDAQVDDLQQIVSLLQAVVGADTHVFSGAKVVAGSGIDPTRLREIVEHPELRCLVADDQSASRVVGFAIVGEDLMSGLLGRSSVVVMLMTVAADERHRGVGHALLSEIADFAEAIDAEQVQISLPTEAREANRYFAKAGFAPLVTRRVTTLSTLRGSLGLAAPLTGREAARRRLLGRRLGRRDVR